MINFNKFPLSIEELQFPSFEVTLLLKIVLYDVMNLNILHLNLIFCSAVTSNAEYNLKDVLWTQVTFTKYRWTQVTFNEDM